MQDAEGIVKTWRMRGKLERGPPIPTADSSSSTSVRPNLSPEQMNLFGNQPLHPLDRVLILGTEAEPDGASWLVRGVVPGPEVRVVQGLFGSNSFRRIEVEHSRQEIDRVMG